MLTERLTRRPGSTSFQVVIAHLPVTFEPPASCVPIWPKPWVTGVSSAPCAAAGSNRWTGSDSYAVYVVERRGDVLIQASAEKNAGDPGAVGVDTLKAALDSLRPVTTAQLRAADGM